MHGRPRKSTPPSKEEEEASALKARNLRALQTQFLHFHHNHLYSKEALEVSAKLLEANPEYYTAWNYRKLALQHNLNLDPESIQPFLDQELRLVENALKKNYKSYGAWHHRKWVMSKGHSSTDRELWLLGEFQNKDARNFHAWNYRRFITALKNVPDQEELNYTTKLIEDNFSNYSAWHNRSFLLSRLLDEGAESSFDKESVLETEYDFVRNALFTDPGDQSGWFYHLWLLDRTVIVENILVSSYPSHGSTVYVSRNGSLDNITLSPFFTYQSNAGTFPFILYFIEPVEGVNSSSVTIEYEYCESNADLTWTPLSACKDGCAQAWLTHLDLPDEELLSSKAYQVEVSLACSQGIISSRGIYSGNSSNITFTVCAPPRNLENVETHGSERISWAMESFCTEEADCEEYRLPNFSHQVSLKSSERPGASGWNLNTIADEITYCRDLLSTMDECKIAKLTLARLLMAQHTLKSGLSLHHQHGTQYEEVLELYRDLMKSDPPHLQYYKDQYSLVLLKQVTLYMEFLRKYGHVYRHSTSPSIQKYFCLRLDNLSLTRIGNIERLLWVQMLDLRNNELRSIEGLEAMQQLICLNLSHNKLGSFAALEPLRNLKLLKVLDISYNEIGAHSINTRRYLCSSPLSHTTESGWNFNEYAISGPEGRRHWEAISIFKDLKNLEQLDIVGNAAATENLKQILFKLMPELKWVDDGERSL